MVDWKASVVCESFLNTTNYVRNLKVRSLFFFFDQKSCDLCNNITQEKDISPDMKMVGFTNISWSFTIYDRIQRLTKHRDDQNTFTVGQPCWFNLRKLTLLNAKERRSVLFLCFLDIQKIMLLNAKERRSALFLGQWILHVTYINVFYIWYNTLT